ncbi:MAG: ATP synthase F1 subunit delta [Bacteroidales bacterium]|nr:ATP synthase F1 subunit delta [Bacteroidales bacterium]
MNYSKVNVRYAKAFFLVALEANKIEEAHKDLLFIQQLTKENKEFRFLLSAPIYNPAEKKQFIINFFKPYVNEITINFLTLLIDNRRENRLFDIIRYFTTLYKQHHQIVDAHLITAISLDQQIIEDFKQKLEQALNKKVHIQNETNNEIIGGFILRIEDKEYDASIKNQLVKIKNYIERTSIS